MEAFLLVSVMLLAPGTTVYSGDGTYYKSDDITATFVANYNLHSTHLDSSLSFFGTAGHEESG